jgi:hypothetical protein
MINLYAPDNMTQVLNSTITGADRINAYTEQVLDKFQSEKAGTMRVYESVVSLLTENSEICETTLKSKNNVVMQTIPHLMGMNKNMHNVVNSLKLSADHHNDGLFLGMNPDQNLHRYIYMGYIR